MNLREGMEISTGEALQPEDLERFSDELHGEVLSQQCMDLTGWESNDFDVQIPGLSTEHEIANRAADQPDPSSSTTNSLLNAVKNLLEDGVFKTKAGRHLDHRFAENVAGFFR